MEILEYIHEGLKKCTTYLSFTLNCSSFNLQDARICGTGHYPSQVLRWNARHSLLAMKCEHRDRVPREIETRHTV